MALAALGGIGLPQWVGRVIAGETVVSLTMLGQIALAMVRYLTATDLIGRQQLKWLAGGACVSGTLALAVWFLPQLLFGESPLPDSWLGFSGLALLADLTVAVLHYRLFDVDRIISRTLAYGLDAAAGAAATPPWSSASGGWWATTPAWSWPSPPWPWPRSSSQPAAASRSWSTGASTATLRHHQDGRGLQRPASASRSTWTR